MSKEFDIEWPCSLPWTGFSNDPDGRVRPCCLYKEHIKDENGNDMYVQTTSVKDIFSSKYMKDLRNQFRSGKKPAGCATCIKDETNGVHSKRMYANQNTTIEFDKEPGLPVEYQMILSNACNLKCRSCTPSHSNLWQAEHKAMFGHTGYKMPHNQPGHKDSLLWNMRSEWMKYVERLEIVGGEPFYIHQWQDLWTELVENNYSKSVSMDMSTNCVIYGGDTLEQFIPKFKRIGVGLSIDGLGKIYNYLRHPGNWDVTKENILKYKELADRFPTNFGCNYTHTISWVNAWELPEFHQWVETYTPKFGVWNNLVHYPRHMSLIMLPLSAKQKIKSKWDSTDFGKYKTAIEGISKFMFSEQPSDEEIAQEYKKFVLHDRFRKESILDIIPSDLKEDLNRFFDTKIIAIQEIQ
jgi:sulfatase maturation enzyme AslB (radical SAM superfamily)